MPLKGTTAYAHNVGPGVRNIGGAFSPSQLATLWAWWDFSTLALADGTAISTVPDLSGNARDLTGVTTTRPLLKTAIQNGLSIARFDGTDDRLDTAAVALPAQWSIAVTAKLSSNTTNQTLVASRAVGTSWGQVQWSSAATHQAIAYDNVTSYTSACPGASNQWNSSVATRSPSAVEGFLNGTSGGAIAAGVSQTPTQAVQVGRDNTVRPLNGDIGEIVICSGVLGATDNQNLQAYLKAKWNTP